MSEHGGGGGFARLLQIGIGLDFDGHGFAQAEQAIKSVQKLAIHMFEVFAAGEAVHFLTELVNETTELADHTKKLAESFGIAGDQFQALTYAAELADVEQGELGAALARLTNEAAQAAAGSTEAAAKFAKLGLHVKDAAGHLRPSGDLLLDVADKIAALKNPSDQAALAVQFFGRSGAKFLPFLKDGAEGLDKFKAELEDMGAVISDELLADSEEYNDAQKRLDYAFRGLKITITTALLPAFRFIVEANRKIVTAFNALIKNTNIVKGALTAIGIALAYAGVRAVFFGNQWLLAWAKAALPVLAVIAGIAALALVIDDLWTYFEGGESVIGDVIESLHEFAYGAQEGEAYWLTAIRYILSVFLEFGSAVVGLVQNLIYIFSNFGEFLQFLGAMLTEWVVQPFMTAFDAVSNGVVALWQTIQTVLVAPFEHFIDGIGQRVVKAWSSIKSVLPGFEVDAPVTTARGDSPLQRGQLGAVAGADGLAGAPGAPGLAAPLPRPTPLPPQPFNVPGRQVAAPTVNTTNSVTVNAPISGAADPQAVGIEVAKQVEEVLQRHHDDAYGALVPTAPGDS